MSAPDPDHRLSVAVMAHPSRASSARRIADELGGAPVVTGHPAGPETSLRTALRAWSAADPGATHHLVVQDDIIVSPHLLDRVRAGIDLFPDAALSFYANAHAHNGAAIRLGAAAGASWVAGLHEFYFPTLATVLPARLIPRYTEWAGQFTDLWEADDRALGRFLIAENVPTVLSIPSFVEHGDLETVAGTPPRGILKATATPPGPGDDRPFHDWVADDYDVCPNLYEGQLEVLVRSAHAGRPGWFKGHWPAVLAELDQPADIAATTLAGLRPLFRGLYDAVTPVFVDGVADTAFAMGLLVGAGRVPVRRLRGRADPDRLDGVRANALLMMVLGGNRGTPVTPASLSTHAKDFAGLLDQAFDAGRVTGEKGNRR